MWVHIVCYEDVDAWILGKFATRLCENLQLLSVEADISKAPEQHADINHHIIYYDYDGKRTTTETMMITHIDSEWKLNKVKSQLVNAEMGICMSLDTLRILARFGVPREKLCFVNPSHDGVMKPRKTIVGIASKVQPDGCKREYLVAQLADRISPGDFKFKIMGAGWDGIVNLMKQKGIEVDYHDHFDYNLYLDFMPSLDFYLYLGQDEGSMGFVDALAAGVPTIVTPQGYHLDAPGGITYAFNEIGDLERIFTEITEKKKNLVRAVSSWTWSEYARKHLLIWDYLLQKRKGSATSKELGRGLEKLGLTDFNLAGEVTGRAQGLPAHQHSGAGASKSRMRILRVANWLIRKLPKGNQ